MMLSGFHFMFNFFHLINLNLIFLSSLGKWKEKAEGIVIRIRRFQLQTPLGAWLGLGTQRRYEAPADLQFKIDKTQCLTFGQ